MFWCKRNIQIQRLNEMNAFRIHYESQWRVLSAIWTTHFSLLTFFFLVFYLIFDEMIQFLLYQIWWEQNFLLWIWKNRYLEANNFYGMAILLLKIFYRLIVHKMIINWNSNNWKKVSWLFLRTKFENFATLNT